LPRPCQEGPIFSPPGRRDPPNLSSAKDGVPRHPGLDPGPGETKKKRQNHWLPAFAGMTQFGSLRSLRSFFSSSFPGVGLGCLRPGLPPGNSRSTQGGLTRATAGRPYTRFGCRYAIFHVPRLEPGNAHLKGSCPSILPSWAGMFHQGRPQGTPLPPV
jgi:hypothetical protein